jgi:hypothetical protein
VYLSHKDVLDFQVYLLEQGGRYEGVSAEMVVDSEGDERYVFWSSTEYGKKKRKYLKAASFKVADLTSCWK